MNDNASEKKSVDMTINPDHLAKQRKKKHPDGKVYGVVNGVTEMHPLGKLHLEDADMTLEQKLKKLTEENVELNARLDKAKGVISSLNKKIEIIEGKLKKYGLE